MTRKFSFRCNLPPRKPPESGETPLFTFGDDHNVAVKLENVARIVQKNLGGRVADALDIAAFVYAADSSISRDRATQDERQIEPWGRTFRLEIGVRDVDFWKRRDVGEKLVRILNFLSDDRYEFKFAKLRHDKAKQDYLNLGDTEDWPFANPPRVTLFSGGLDSLAGAAEHAARGENLVLVSHRSVTKVASRQDVLLRDFRATYPDVRVLSVPVWVHRLHKNDSSRTGEYTQRTRSFLFWGIALAVGESLNAGGVRFFENGVVSLNLPVADQVLRARASRTTHPLALKMLSELSDLVLNRPFVVENPYIFLSKTDVVRRAMEFGASALIERSCSCAHTHMQRMYAWHCGCCSQCIDRRLAILAAGAGEFDPAADYRVDVLEGPRTDARDQTMACNYVRHAAELAKMSPDDMAQRFNMELSRAVRAFPGDPNAGQELIELHRRHGTAVMTALGAAVAKHSLNIISGDLEPTSLLGLTIARKHLQATWSSYAERIADILANGIPRACHTEKPKNETHLQEICDGMLAAADEKLVREYPYLRWASRMTKPDWSDEALGLWVELKYVRASSDVRKIGEDIAADITKYGDNDRRTLFVAYDPSAHIVDREDFSRDITRHLGAAVRIIR